MPPHHHAGGPPKKPLPKKPPAKKPPPPQPPGSFRGLVQPDLSSPFAGISDTNAPARNTKTPHLTAKVQLAKVQKARLENGGLLTPEQIKSEKLAKIVLATPEARLNRPTVPGPTTPTGAPRPRTPPRGAPPPSKFVKRPEAPVTTLSNWFGGPARAVAGAVGDAVRRDAPLIGKGIDAIEPFTPAAAIEDAGDKLPELWRKAKPYTPHTALAKTRDAASVAAGTVLEAGASIPGTFFSPPVPKASSSGAVGAPRTPVERVKPTHLVPAERDVTQRWMGAAEKASRKVGTAGEHSVTIDLSGKDPDFPNPFAFFGNIVPPAGAANRGSVSEEDFKELEAQRGGLGGLPAATRHVLIERAVALGWPREDVIKLVDSELIHHSGNKPANPVLQFVKNLGQFGSAQAAIPAGLLAIGDAGVRAATGDTDPLVKIGGQMVEGTKATFPQSLGGDRPFSQNLYWHPGETLQNVAFGVGAADRALGLVSKLPELPRKTQPEGFPFEINRGTLSKRPITRSIQKGQDWWVNTRNPVTNTIPGIGGQARRRAAVRQHFGDFEARVTHPTMAVAMEHRVGLMETARKIGGERAAVLLSRLQGSEPGERAAFYREIAGDVGATKRRGARAHARVSEAALQSMELNAKDQAFIDSARAAATWATETRMARGQFSDLAADYRIHQEPINIAARRGDPLAQRLLTERAAHLAALRGGGKGGPAKSRVNTRAEASLAEVERQIKQHEKALERMGARPEDIVERAGTNELPPRPTKARARGLHRISVLEHDLETPGLSAATKANIETKLAKLRAQFPQHHPLRVVEMKQKLSDRPVAGGAPEPGELPPGVENVPAGGDYLGKSPVTEGHYVRIRRTGEIYRSQTGMGPWRFESTKAGWDDIGESIVFPKEGAPEPYQPPPLMSREEATGEKKPITPQISPGHHPDTGMPLPPGVRYRPEPPGSTNGFTPDQAYVVLDDAGEVEFRGTLAAATREAAARHARQVEGEAYSERVPGEDGGDDEPWTDAERAAVREGRPPPPQKKKAPTKATERQRLADAQRGRQEAEFDKSRKWQHQRERAPGVWETKPPAFREAYDESFEVGRLEREARHEQDKATGWDRETLDRERRAREPGKFRLTADERRFLKEKGIRLSESGMTLEELDKAEHALRRAYDKKNWPKASNSVLNKVEAARRRSEAHYYENLPPDDKAIGDPEAGPDELGHVITYPKAYSTRKGAEYRASQMDKENPNFHVEVYKEGDKWRVKKTRQLLEGDDHEAGEAAQDAFDAKIDAERQKLFRWLNGEMPPGADKAAVAARWEELQKQHVADIQEQQAKPAAEAPTPAPAKAKRLKPDELTPTVVRPKGGNVFAGTDRSIGLFKTVDEARAAAHKWEDEYVPEDPNETTPYYDINQRGSGKNKQYEVITHTRIEGDETEEAAREARHLADIKAIKDPEERAYRERRAAEDAITRETYPGYHNTPSAGPYEAKYNEKSKRWNAVAKDGSWRGEAHRFREDARKEAKRKNLASRSTHNEEGMPLEWAAELEEKRTFRLGDQVRHAEGKKGVITTAGVGDEARVKWYGANGKLGPAKPVDATLTSKLRPEETQPRVAPPKEDDPIQAGDQVADEDGKRGEVTRVNPDGSFMVLYEGSKRPVRHQAEDSLGPAVDPADVPPRQVGHKIVDKSEHPMTGTIEGVAEDGTLSVRWVGIPRVQRGVDPNHPIADVSNPGDTFGWEIGERVQRSFPDEKAGTVVGVTPKKVRVMWDDGTTDSGDGGRLISERPATKAKAGVGKPPEKFNSPGQGVRWRAFTKDGKATKGYKTRKEAVAAAEEMDTKDARLAEVLDANEKRKARIAAEGPKTPTMYERGLPENPTKGQKAEAARQRVLSDKAIGTFKVGDDVMMRNSAGVVAGKVTSIADNGDVSVEFPEHMGGNATVAPGDLEQNWIKAGASGPTPRTEPNVPTGTRSSRQAQREAAAAHRANAPEFDDAQLEKDLAEWQRAKAKADAAAKRRNAQIGVHETAKRRLVKRRDKLLVRADQAAHEAGPGAEAVPGQAAEALRGSLDEFIAQHRQRPGVLEPIYLPQEVPQPLTATFRGSRQPNAVMPTEPVPRMQATEDKLIHSGDYRTTARGLSEEVRRAAVIQARFDLFNAVKEEYASKAIGGSIADPDVVYVRPEALARPVDLESTVGTHNISDEDIAITQEAFRKQLESNTIPVRVDGYVPEHGEVWQIPKSVYEELHRSVERYNPGSLARQFDRMNRSYQRLMLSKPSTLVSNVAGNPILAGMGGASPIERGPLGRREAGWKPGYELAKHPEWLPPQLQEGGLASQLLSAGEKPARTPVGKWINYSLSLQRASEQAGRAALYHHLAGPHVAREMEATGMTADQVLRRLAAGEDPHGAELARKVEHFLGNMKPSTKYGRGVETTLNRSLLFHRWLGHILTLTMYTLPVKYPGRAILLQRISEVGDDYRKHHGVFPSWYIGMLPLMQHIVTSSGQAESFTRTIPTGSIWPSANLPLPLADEAGANPWAAAINSANPLLRAAIETPWGRNLAADRPYKDEAGNAIGPGLNLDLGLGLLQRATPYASYFGPFAGKSDTAHVFNWNDRVTKNKHGHVIKGYGTSAVPYGGGTPTPTPQYLAGFLTRLAVGGSGLQNVPGKTRGTEFRRINQDMPTARGRYFTQVREDPDVRARVRKAAAKRAAAAKKP